MKKEPVAEHRRRNCERIRRRGPCPSGGKECIDGNNIGVLGLATQAVQTSNQHDVDTDSDEVAAVVAVAPQPGTSRHCPRSTYKRLKLDMMEKTDNRIVEAIQELSSNVCKLVERIGGLVGEMTRVYELTGRVLEMSCRQ